MDILIKTKDEVLFCDLYDSTSYLNLKYDDFLIRKNNMIWKAKDSNDIIVGTRFIRGADLLRNVVLTEKDLSVFSIKEDILPKIKEVYGEYGVLEDDKLVSTVYVAQGDKCYRILPNGEISKQNFAFTRFLYDSLDDLCERYDDASTILDLFLDIYARRMNYKYLAYKVISSKDAEVEHIEREV